MFVFQSLNSEPIMWLIDVLSGMEFHRPLIYFKETLQKMKRHNYPCSTWSTAL